MRLNRYWSSKSIAQNSQEASEGFFHGRGGRKSASRRPLEAHLVVSLAFSLPEKGGGGATGTNLDAHKVAHLKGEHTMEPRDLQANTFLYFTVTG